MKLKLFSVITLSTFALSLNACLPSSDTTLTQQYESGALQWQIARNEVDPNTLIHQAIIESNSEVIRFLLSHGINVDYPNENGMSPLTIAILNKSKDAVKLLLANGATPNPAVKWNNMSPVQLTISMKEPDSTKLLVEHGANINIKDKSSCVLTKAIDLSWKEIVSLMIDKGADIHSDGSDSPLMHTVYLAQNGDRSLLELLLKKGANINQEQKLNGRAHNTPLLQAIRNGALPLVEFLVKSGADVNQAINYIDGRTCTPIKLALDSGHIEIVQYLLQHGARG